MPSKWSATTRPVMQELRDLGLRHTWRVLEVFDNPDEITMPWWPWTSGFQHMTIINERERLWIVIGHMLSWPLVNKNAGGKRARVTDETRQRMSAAKKLQWQSPSYRARQSGDNHISRRDPEVATRCANAQRRPEVRVKQSVAHKGKQTGDDSPMRRPEIRAKSKRNTIAAMQRPEVLANQAAGIAKRHLDNQILCGTNSAWVRNDWLHRHGKLNCGPCEHCVVAHLQYGRDSSARARRKRGVPLKSVPACGTVNGWRYNHERKKRGLPNCGPCDLCVRTDRAHQKSVRDTAGPRIRKRR